MVLEYSVKDLRSNNIKLNDCIYISDHDTLYKNCYESLSVPRDLDKRIFFVSDMGEIEGLIGPLNVLSDNCQIYGYEMEYLKEYQSLQDLIKSGQVSSMSFDEKKLILLKLFRTLKKINEQYELGDINLSNIMINDNDARFIDFENGRPIGSAMPMLYKFHFPFIGGTQADSLKLLIDAICLLYNTDLEYELCKINPRNMYDFCKLHLFDKSILSYLIDFEKIISDGFIDTIYFDEYLDSMHAISSKDIRRVQTSIGAR